MTQFEPTKSQPASQAASPLADAAAGHQLEGLGLSIKTIVAAYEYRHGDERQRPDHASIGVYEQFATRVREAISAATTAQPDPRHNPAGAPELIEPRILATAPDAARCSTLVFLKSESGRSLGYFADYQGRTRWQAFEDGLVGLDFSAASTDQSLQPHFIYSKEAFWAELAMLRDPEYVTRCLTSANQGSLALDVQLRFAASRFGAGVADAATIRYTVEEFENQSHMVARVETDFGTCRITVRFDEQLGIGAIRSDVVK